MLEYRQAIDQAGVSSFSLVPLATQPRARNRTQGAMRRRTRRQLIELEEMKRAVRRCREELLDFNPTISLMAETLEKAIDLEIAARGCAVSLERSNSAA